MSSLKTYAIATAAVVLAVGTTAVTAGQGKDKEKPVQEAPASPRPDPPQAAPVFPKNDPQEGVVGQFGGPTDLSEFQRGLMPEELAGRYRTAQVRSERLKKLHSQGLIGQEELETGDAALQQARSDIAAARRRWEEELELLRIRTRRQGGLERARAQQELARAIVARNTRINERIKGAISEEEVRKAEAELRRAETEIVIEATKIEEIEARIGQLERRLADLHLPSNEPDASARPGR